MSSSSGSSYEPREVEEDPIEDAVEEAEEEVEEPSDPNPSQPNPQVNPGTLAETNRLFELREEYKASNVANLEFAKRHGVMFT